MECDYMEMINQRGNYKANTGKIINIVVEQVHTISARNCIIFWILRRLESLLIKINLPFNGRFQTVDKVFDIFRRLLS